jgi:hypothetical protein
VGSGVAGPGRATMIRLVTMLAARTALMIQKAVWVQLRFRVLRLRLAKEMNLLVVCGWIIPQVGCDAKQQTGLIPMFLPSGSLAVCDGLRYNGA